MSTELNDKDLNLLIVFETLMNELNVSQAAQRLRMSQPALSHALSRLRLNFNDPLFVRLPRGMAPTDRARALKAQVAKILEASRELYAQPTSFDPAKAEGRIVLETTDYIEHIVYPKLLPYLAKAAPGVALVSKHLRGEFPKQALEQGEADIAIGGFFKSIPEGFFQQKLFIDELVCVLRKKHPLASAKNGISMENYLEASHILVSLQGDLVGQVDAALAKKKLKRKVVAGIANFITPGLIASESDFLLTGPRRLAETYQERYPVDIFPLPPPLASQIRPMTLIQVWHERSHQDPLRAWFRSVLHQFSATQGLKR